MLFDIIRPEEKKKGFCPLNNTLESTQLTIFDFICKQILSKRNLFVVERQPHNHEVV